MVILHGLPDELTGLFIPSKNANRHEVSRFVAFIPLVKISNIRSQDHNLISICLENQTITLHCNDSCRDGRANKVLRTHGFGG